MSEDRLPSASIELRYQEGSSNKFYRFQFAISDTSYIVITTYGRIRTTGKSSRLAMPLMSQALIFLQKKMSEKSLKGYKLASWGRDTIELPQSLVMRHPSVEKFVRSINDVLATRFYKRRNVEIACEGITPETPHASESDAPVSTPRSKEVAERRRAKAKFVF